MERESFVLSAFCTISNWKLIKTLSSKGTCWSRDGSDLLTENITNISKMNYFFEDVKIRNSWEQVNECNCWDHWLFYVGGPYHIETNPLICKANLCHERVKVMSDIVKHHLNFEKVLQSIYVIIWYERIKYQGSNVA